MEINYSLSEVREMSGDDQEFVDEMLDAFVQNNGEYLKLLNEAFAAEDWKTVKFNAHKIKPSILLFKIEALTENILKLNDYAGNEKSLNEIPALVSELNEGLNLVFEKISQEKV